MDLFRRADSRPSSNRKRFAWKGALLQAGGLLLLVLTATTAHAQNGCADSPECPTAVLGLAGAAAFTFIRRFKR
jgi:XrtJ-associated TM-motif-TM protein